MVCCAAKRISGVTWRGSWSSFRSGAVAYTLHYQSCVVIRDHDAVVVDCPLQVRGSTSCRALLVASVCRGHLQAFKPDMCYCGERHCMC